MSACDKLLEVADNLRGYTAVISFIFYLPKTQKRVKAHTRHLYQLLLPEIGPRAWEHCWADHDAEVEPRCHRYILSILLIR